MLKIQKAIKKLNMKDKEGILVHSVGPFVVHLYLFM